MILWNLEIIRIILKSVIFVRPVDNISEFKTKKKNIQFIHDNKWNTTGVFIPIEEWLKLKTKYIKLQKEESENLIELANWQKEIIDVRINEYYTNQVEIINFDLAIKEIENKF